MIIGEKPSIFLSYARADDEEFVRRLQKELTIAGFRAWFDRISMPSRQLTFYQEIRDAIVAHDRLVLIVGPLAVTSAYVEQEWRFALEIGKGINPVVRQDGDGVDGYTLIPEELKLLHAEDFREDAGFSDALKNLIRQLSEPLAPLGPLLSVPTLPAHYRAQRERLRSLRDQLLADLRQPVVISGAAARIGVHGMGGIGKSVLAAALARDPEVRRAFPDGIVWIRLGQQPNLVELLRQAVLELGGSPAFEDVRAGREALRARLEANAVLIVADDVWQRSHADAFDVIGPRCRLLITSRDNTLVYAVAGVAFSLQLPSGAEALSLLAAAARVPSTDALPSVAHEVAEECGRLPLALALCGAMAGAGVPWKDLLDALRERDLEFVATEHALESQHASVWRAIEVSVRALSQEDQQRFSELAVFPEDEAIPEAAVTTLWVHTGGLSGRQARRLLATFGERALIQLDRLPVSEDDGGGARITLHDLLHDFAVRLASRRSDPALAKLHAEITAAYAKQCPNGWASGPRDGYFFQHLRHHLVRAGRRDELAQLLLQIEWLEVKSSGTAADAATPTASAYDLLEDFTAALVPEQDKTRSGGAGELDVAAAPVHNQDFLRYLFELIRAHFPMWLGAPERLYAQIYPFLRESSAPAPAADWLGLYFERSNRRGIWFRQTTPVAVAQTEVRLSIPTVGRSTGPVCFAADGRRLFGVTGRCVYGWWLATGREILFHRLEQDAVLFRERLEKRDFLVLLRDGRLLRVANGTEVEPMLGPGIALSCADYSPRGNALAVATPSGQLGMWDLDLGKWCARSTGSRTPIRCICFDMSGDRLLVARETNVCRCLDARTLAALPLNALSEGALEAVAATPSPGWYLGCLDGSIKHWMPDAESALALDKTGPFPVCALVCSGGMLLAGDSRGVVRCWDVSPAVSFVGYASFAEGIVRALAAAGDFLAVVRDGAPLQVASLGAALASTSRWRAPICTNPSWLASSRVAFAGNAAGDIFISDETSSETVVVNAQFNGVAAAAASAPLWVAGTGKGIMVFDSERQKPIGYRYISGSTTAVAIHASGEFSISGHTSGIAVVWDSPSVGELGRIPAHVGSITGLVYTSDASQFVSASVDGTVALWQVALRPADASEGRGMVIVSGDRLGRSVLPGLVHREMGRRSLLKAPGEAINALALSGDETLLSVAAGERVFLWSFPALTPVAELPAAGGALASIAYSPDDSCLAGVTADARCVLWKLEDRSIQCTFQAFPPGLGCAWRPDGSALAIVAGGALNLFQIQGLGLGEPIVSGRGVAEKDSIEIACPWHSASSPWRVPAFQRGRRVLCPECGGAVRIAPALIQMLPFPHSDPSDPHSDLPK